MRRSPRAKLEPSIGALGATRDSDDQHDPLWLTDLVHDAQIADSKAQEATSRHPLRAGRVFIEGEAKDGPAQPGGIVRAELAQLALGGWREPDIVPRRPG